MVGLLCFYKSRTCFTFDDTPSVARDVEGAVPYDLVFCLYLIFKLSTKLSVFVRKSFIFPLNKQKISKNRNRKLRKVTFSSCNPLKIGV